MWQYYVNIDTLRAVHVSLKIQKLVQPNTQWYIKQLVSATVCAARTKLKQNPIVSLSILLPCHLFGLTCSWKGTAVAHSLGYSHNRAGLIHKRSESSLVMTEESGGPNLAAFVPLKLLMMHSRERSAWRGWGRCEGSLSMEGRRVSNKGVEHYNQSKGQSHFSELWVIF